MLVAQDPLAPAPGAVAGPASPLACALAPYPLSEPLALDGVSIAGRCMLPDSSRLPVFCAADGAAARPLPFWGDAMRIVAIDQASRACIAAYSAAAGERCARLATAFLCARRFPGCDPATGQVHAACASLCVELQRSGCPGADEVRCGEG